MSHRVKRSGLLALVATMSIGVGATPAFAVSKAEKNQNTAIKKSAKALSKNNVDDKLTKASLKKARTNITTLQNAGKALGTLAQSLDTDRKNLNGTLIPTFVKSLTDLRDGLVAAGAGLTALKTGLETLAAGVQDPVGGLLALNNARPKFAIVNGAGANGPLTPLGKTPGFVSVTKFGTGIYLLDFGQDVSSRAPQITLNTPGPATAGTPVGQIVNCGASTDPAASFCVALLGAGMGGVNRALVTTQDGEVGTAADFIFTATEIAG